MNKDWDKDMDMGMIIESMLDDDENVTNSMETLKRNIHNIKSIPSASYWESDIEIIESCGDMPETIDVIIYPLVRAKINTLMEHFEKMEWLAYFTGEKIDDIWHIKDLVIPEQKVNPVSVYDIQDPGVSKIGVIHSHHDMGNDFSHTDDEFINQNNDISLCVSKHGIKGHVRIKTSCNKYVLIKANIIYSVENFNKEEFINTFSDKIKIVPFHNTIDNESEDECEFIDLSAMIVNYQFKLVSDVNDKIYNIDEYKNIINIINMLDKNGRIDLDKEDKYYIAINDFFEDTDGLSIEAVDLMDEFDQNVEDTIIEKDMVSLRVLVKFLIKLINEIEAEAEV